MQDIDRIEAAPLSDEERVLAERTLALVLGLPEDGAVIFVHSRTVLAPLRDLVLRKRGLGVHNATRFIVAPAEHDEAPFLTGLSLPVYRDPFTLAQRTYLRALGGAWRL
ncbi:hypothetical protein ACLBYG_22265 [Methylobacterium sp. D53M]